MGNNNINKNALITLQKRYFIKDKQGKIKENWKQLCERVSKAIALDEKTIDLNKKWENKYFDLIYNLRFIPNTPTLMNAGKKDGQLAACFVLPIEDNMESIMRAVTNSALIHKCVYIEQDIETNSGIKKAKDISVGDYLMSPNGPVIVKKVFSTGKKECYRIFNKKLGISAIVGKDHPILTKFDYAGEKSAAFRKVKYYYKTWRTGICQEKFYLNSELSKGFLFEDVVNGRRNNYNDIDIPKIATKELMYFLGAWFGDGSKSYLTVSLTGRQGIKDYFVDCAKNIFGIEKYTSCSEKMKSEDADIYDISFNSKKLSSYLDFLGFYKEKNNIPNWVKYLSNELRGAFLQGLFDTDGSVCSGSNSSAILCSNKNEQVCISIAQIAESCGLRVSYPNPEFNRKYNKSYYHVYVYKQSIEKMCSLFNLTLLTRTQILKDKRLLPRKYNNIFYSELNKERMGELDTVDFEVDGHVYLIDNIISHNSGGGTGFDFSRLRPANSIVSTTAGAASGPISFMRMINGVTEEIKQGGTRRGANMGILRVDHPDILDFIDCKQDTSKITNFNISVAITDKFMKALKKGGDYFLYNPHLKKNVGKLNAKEVFDKICKNSHTTGEPGLFFIDTANKNNKWGNIVATNPCGEQPIPDNESCTLGSVNLGKYVVDKKFDFKRLDSDIETSIRFLDSVVSVNKYPVDIIRETHQKTRRIGLGVMGFADTLAILGIAYGSDESFEFADKIFGRLYDVSIGTSMMLGEEKGICEACQELGEKRRNYWVNTVAPTGSISIIAGCSSGIEPYYAIGFEKNVLDGNKLKEISYVFKKVCEDNKVELTDEILDKVCSHRSIKDVKEIPKPIRDTFQTAADVSPENHVKMQSVFQKYCDSGISKTINMEESATVEDIEKAFLLAYDLGCKGVTAYRDGSRPNQVLSVKKEEHLDRKVFNRTAEMNGCTYKVKTPLGNVMLTVNENVHGDTGEVILVVGKSGADVNAFAEALGRMVSISIQHGIPIHKITKQLKGIKGEDVIFFSGDKYTSIPDLVGRIIDKKQKEKTKEDSEATLARCPSCETRLWRAEGCSTCASCGYSKC